MPNLPLEDALQLVRLYGERGSPKYEKAALRWLESRGNRDLSRVRDPPAAMPLKRRGLRKTSMPPTR
jgi:hypothetical protein